MPGFLGVEDRRDLLVGDLETPAPQRAFFGQTPGMDDMHVRAVPLGKRGCKLHDRPIERHAGLVLGRGIDRGEDLARLAGLTVPEAVKTLSETRVRVQTIGFAPSQPYLGELPPAWDIPRQTELTPRAPVGALTVAIRQLVLFAVSTPTGWRHVGQTGFRTFRKNAVQPFALTPGDEMIFPSVSKHEFEKILAQDSAGNGGAERETLS